MEVEEDFKEEEDFNKDISLDSTSRIIPSIDLTTGADLEEAEGMEIIPIAEEAITMAIATEGLIITGVMVPMEEEEEEVTDPMEMEGGEEGENIISIAFYVVVCHNIQFSSKDVFF
jgi:hypothetical protein